MTLIPIQDLADPRLEPYRELNRRNLTRFSGKFIAEGDKLVERLITSRFEVDSLLAEEAIAERFEPQLSPDVPIYVAGREQLEATTGFNFHRGVLACGRRGAPATLQSVLTGLDLAGNSASDATMVVCPDVQDPTNLGSIIRSAAAFGCTAVILGPRCADPLSRRVLRVSMGAALHLPVVESPNLAAAIADLQATAFEVVATVLDPNAQPLSAARRTPRMALLFGSEGHGLSPEWLVRADRWVTIPMHLGIDSLNVAVAAAVVLYHFTANRTVH
jgi:tRNA G18 (ribose-2'-O)-methylase SpoU